MDQKAGMELDDMKLLKSELKNVIRECLLEILQEGIGPIQSKNVSIPQEYRKPKTEQKSVSKDLAIREAIKREAGGNKMMEDIFSDTAANTLPTMLKGEKASPAPTGTVERIVEAAEPVDLFGEEAASKWAALAFMGGPTSKIRE